MKSLSLTPTFSLAHLLRHMHPAKMKDAAKESFRTPTLSEVAQKKLQDAEAELQSAIDARKLADYRIHMAQSEVDALHSWMAQK